MFNLISFAESAKDKRRWNFRPPKAETKLTWG
jgi:hypothetical protein